MFLLDDLQSRAKFSIVNATRQNSNLRKSLMFYVPSIKEMIKEIPIPIDKLPAFNPKRILQRRITRSLTK